jgi:hypothetical protein
MGSTTQVWSLAADASAVTGIADIQVVIARKTTPGASRQSPVGIPCDGMLLVVTLLSPEAAHPRRVRFTVDIGLAQHLEADKAPIMFTGITLSVRPVTNRG